MKQALIIMPDFYEYADAIKQEFYNKGYTVDIFYEQPSTITYLILKKNERLFKTRSVYTFFLHNLYRRIRCTEKQYDFFLVIRGNILTNKFIKKITNKCLKNNARKVLYLWDSLNNIDHKGKIGQFFDELFTFDSRDVKNNCDWKLLPLFYSEKFDADRMTNISSIKYDLSCIASYNDDRYLTLLKINEANPGLSLKVILYLDKKIYDVKIKTNPMFRKLNMDWITFKPLPTDAVAEINLSSKAIIDIPNKRQRGLSMRSIESVGLRKKLITTNPGVLEYDINQNILFISENNYKIDDDWLNVDYNLEQAVRYNYSLSNWVDVILQNTAIH